jgi:hypothetical protein
MARCRSDRLSRCQCTGGEGRFKVFTLHGKDVRDGATGCLEALCLEFRQPVKGVVIVEVA